MVLVIGLPYFLLDSFLSVLSVSSPLTTAQESELIISLGRTANTTRETPHRRRLCASHPPHTWILVDTCRSRQQKERVC